MHDVDFAAPTNPFSDLPDPRFTYRHNSFQAVCADLLYARLSERPGLTLIAGPEGSGKTTLLEVLMDERTSADRYHCISAHRAMTFKTILEQTARAFGLDEDVADIGKTFGKDLTGLGAFLNRADRGGGKVILMIDRAETLSKPVLLKMAELSRLEQGEGKLLQIVLAVTLEDGRLPAAYQVASDSIAFETRLEPLDAEEVSAYIAYRLAMAGHDDSMPFTNEALEALTEYSQGLPARINRLCRTALQICQGRFADMAGADMVDEAAAACGFKPDGEQGDKGSESPSDLALIEDALAQGGPPDAKGPDWDLALAEDLPPSAKASETAGEPPRNEAAGNDTMSDGPDARGDHSTARGLRPILSDLEPLSDLSFEIAPGEPEAARAAKRSRNWSRLIKGETVSGTLWRMRIAAAIVVLVVAGAVVIFLGKDAGELVRAGADSPVAAEPVPVPETAGETRNQEIAALAAKVEALTTRMAELRAEGAAPGDGGGSEATPLEFDQRLVRLEETIGQIAATLEGIRGAGPAEAGTGEAAEAPSALASDSAALEGNALMTPLPDNPEDLLRLIQEALVEFGFQVGNPDGRLGALSRKAIEEYQSSQGLKVTGEPDRALLQHLDIYRGLRTAIDRYHRGDWPAALKIYDDIVAAQPHDPDARLFRGLLRVRMGLVEEALADLAADPGPSADPTVAYFKPARVYYIQERLKALGFDPGRYDGLLTEGTRKAIKLYQHLQELPITGEPTAALLKHIEVYSRHLAAVDAYQNSDYLKAVELYDVVLRMDPDDANAYFNRGLAYRALGRSDQALADYDLALRYAPDLTKVYYDRGKIRWQRGDYSAAVADYWSAFTSGLF